MNRITRSPILLLMLIMLAMAVINGRFADPLGWLMNMALMLPAIVIGLSFHEFGHAVVAYRLGDHTPKLQGRVTISPLAHIDPFGFLALMFVGFGWGKPVQINPGNFRHPRRDEFLVGIAGVTINLIIAIATAGILKLYFSVAAGFANTYMGSVIADILVYIIFVNIILMVFNLMPVPPLDGFGLLTQIFDLQKKSWYESVYRNGFIILLALLIFDVIDRVLTPTVNFIFNTIMGLFFG